VRVNDSFNNDEKIISVTDKRRRIIRQRRRDGGAVLS